jgi:hypothetical protein
MIISLLQASSLTEFSLLDVQKILSPLLCQSLVGVPIVAEIKPVEPEEAKTSVGNKKVEKEFIFNYL